MERLSKHQQEKIIFEILEPYMNDFNMSYAPYQGVKSSFVSSTDFEVMFLMFQFNSVAEPTFSLGLSFLEVEKIMVEIGNPNVEYLERVTDDQYTNCTVYCSQKDLTYDVRKNRLLSQDRAESYARSMIDFMEGYGWLFFQRYSYMPNVLDEINNIQNEKKYWGQLLCGQADHFFRGLLIAKLCNDPKFEEKMSYVDSVFNNPVYNLFSWFPYYEKLKAKISSMISKF